MKCSFYTLFVLATRRKLFAFCERERKRKEGRRGVEGDEERGNERKKSRKIEIKKEGCIGFHIVLILVSAKRSRRITGCKLFSIYSLHICF